MHFHRTSILSLVSAACLALLLGAGCGDDDSPTQPSSQYDDASAFDAGVALAWGELALELTKSTPGFTPPVASRAFGYLGVAFYEALVPGIENHRSLGGQLNGLGALPEPEAGARYHWPTVANSVLASMARLLYPTAPADLLAEIDALEASFVEQASKVEADDVMTRSISRGQSVANAIYVYSLSDGGHEGYFSNFPDDYVPPVGDGLWVPTPQLGGGAPQPALQPYWGQVRPFVLPVGDPNALCDPGAPPAFSTDTLSAFRAEAFEVYDVVENITAEETTIALYWADDPGGTSTPPGHSLSILLQVCEVEDKDLAFAAEAFARVGIAVADAFISCWHSKYEYNLLRPITYIREYIDADWDVVVNTPPFPEYTSGHSVQSGAAFAVLEELFGDGYSFTDHTHDELGYAARSFASFAEAADEAAISRLYGGIHYRAAIELGVDQGRCVAGYVNALEFEESN